jgi:CheY-like chemotaxis protein
MLDGRAILIVEDHALIALDLAEAVESMGGRVVGPVANVSDGLMFLQMGTAAAAIIDVHLTDRDVTPLALQLLRIGKPFVIYTAGPLPAELRARAAELPIVLKPAEADQVLKVLAAQIAAHGRPAGTPVPPPSLSEPLPAADI